MNKEKWYKRDDIEYWKKEYLELSKQLEEKQIVLDKIKEYMKTLSDEYAADNYDIKCDVFNKIYDLLEEIE